jgi:signal transduction histidine kinase
MFRFSARAIVILAAFCFTILVALQIVWMESAYHNEATLYTRAKKQFESELRLELAQNEVLKKGLREFLNHYRNFHSLDQPQLDWYYFNFIKAIDFSTNKEKFAVSLDGVSIAERHQKSSMRKGMTTIIAGTYETPDSLQIAKAGKLCINCILDSGEGPPFQEDYQIVLFYKGQWAGFFEKMGFLIFISLILLVVLGWLFREIIRKYEQEKNLSGAKNDFINNMTHELQTPVFAIQMANKLIEQKTDELSGIAPLTGIIRKEAHQLKEHVARILELASLEEGQVELSSEVTELNGLIEQKRPTIELMLKAKNGILKTCYSGNPLYAALDKVHFNNILVSLTDNAIKYNVNEPRVNIETGEEKSRVYLKYTDNGIGIRQEYLNYVTDKFFRVPDVNRKGITGFGLGLSYVKQIVGLHQGEIKLSSTEGKGTTVTILLPKAMVHV